MSRRPYIPPDELLDLLADGNLLKQIAADNRISPNSLASVLMYERRRTGARTNMQLLAMHLRKKISAS